MATAGNKLPSPITFSERYGIIYLSIHSDMSLSYEQLALVNSELFQSGNESIGTKKRKVSWAVAGESGIYWTFTLETNIVPTDEDNESTSLHFLLRGHRCTSELPSAYMRSRRIRARVQAVVDALSRERLRSDFLCSLAWHRESPEGPLTNLIPLLPDFPSDSVIQEISGVIGGSTDGAVKFVVDRASSTTWDYHVSLIFPSQQTLSSNTLDAITEQGASMMIKLGALSD